MTHEARLVPSVRRLAPDGLRRLGVLTSAIGLLVVAIAAGDISAHPRFRVTLDRAISAGPMSGRLLVFMTDNPQPVDTIGPAFGEDAKHVWIVAKEIQDLAPGESIELDAGDPASPEPLGSAPAGDYQVMALLDVDHSAAYAPISAGDARSSVVRVRGLKATSQVDLTLSERVAEPPLDPAEGGTPFDFVSPLLTRFWGRPTHMRGIVVLPPGYATSRRRYPTVYFTHGFGGHLGNITHGLEPGLAKGMQDGNLPAMIWVLLDQSFPTGTHEFADSVNNGPWGSALTTELVPYLEHQYRMDAVPRGRFLNGHSSGGWATLWLQIDHPSFFGGTWSTSPDPVDFREFTNADLSTDGNIYRTSDGAARPLIRMDGRTVESLEQFARREAVLGDYGGQFSSFEWVFSPRGPDGRPLQLFSRHSGAIDRTVAAYWLEHFDIRRVLAMNAARLVPRLRGKIHVIVGTEDTFFLDRAVRLLQKDIVPLGYQAQFTFLEGRNHFDLYKGGLITQIATQMYAVARPSAKWKPRVAPLPATKLD